MRISLQLVVQDDGGAPATVTEIAQFERDGLDVGSLGLHLEEAKSLLGRLQRTMVAAQVAEVVARTSVCLTCGAQLACKGHHHLVFRSAFSPRNLMYMRAFAEAWPDDAIVQQAVAQLPWGHNLKLLEMLSDVETRAWYARAAVEHGWSRNVLVHQIETRLHERQGAALSNFHATLPAQQSELAQQLLKDPYQFDFLTLGTTAHERELERTLLAHLKDFLVELGVGFAFVGSQYHLSVGGQDYYLDLLFYHLKLRCFIVVELKMDEFKHLPDQSRARSEEALALARKASDPFGLALCLIFAAELHQYRREVQLAREYADAAIALSSDQGFPFYLGWGRILRGWALAEQGSYEEGIAQMHQGLSAREATGAALGRPTLLGLLANAYGKAGQAEAGLRVLSEALALVKNTGERFAEPILLRLKGELILMLSGDDAGSSTSAKEAEACFQAAIAMAHDQGARSVELNGALSVARLWQRCGKTDAARSILAGILDTFTEGFDTVDWQDAKVLLDNLT